MAQSITLQTSDSDIVSSDVLGRLSFAASSESSGSDAVLIGASIYAMAESNFTEISNATSIIFATASSESAIAKLKISSQGHFLPILDKTYDIGASGTKFRNVFAENGKFENISISNLSDPYEILYITDSSGNVSSTDLLKVDVANTEIDLGGDLMPTSNLAYDLGSSSYKFRDTYTDKVILNSGSAIPATTSNTVYNVSGELYYNNNVVALLPSGGVQGQILQKYSTTSNILEWIDNFATEIRVYVKNTTGSALTKGQAVYINGAQGDHPTIALAIADGESSSSKTLGLLKQNLAINEFGYVIAEGALDGIDTSAASAAGDLIYLSPTTAGGVVYGLANRPTAPNHMVFIGYVVVKQQNNGKIFIKVQNGFELGELHNVATNGTANGTFLQYNTASGLWLASTSGNFTTLQLNGTTVSVTGHTHTSSDITNFNSSVSGLLPTIANSGDNRILTSTGSSVGINAEANLTFDGTNLNLNNQTASTIASFDSSKNLVSLATATYPSLTELSYVKGVTSAIQTQIDTKAATSTTITAGSGLAGGGSLAANRTIDIGQGDGITVSADSIAVDSTVIRTTGVQTMSGAKTFSAQTVFASGTAAAPGISILGDTDTGIGQLSANGTNSLSIMTSGVERVTINSAGNVGIGIATPTLNTNGTVLHIHNSTASRASMIRFTNNESGSTATDGLMVGKWSDGTNYVYDYDNYDLVLGAHNGNKVRIHSVGTSFYQSANGTPALGSKNFYAATFENLSAGYGLAIGGVNASTGSAFLQVQNFSTATAYDLLLQPLGGNVGIGTSSPSFKLDVSGAGRIGNGVSQGNPSSTDIKSTAHTLLSGTGGNYLAFGQYGSGSNYAQWIQSSFDNPSTATYNLVLQPLGGNVGIGTTSPPELLSVFKDNNGGRTSILIDNSDQRLKMSCYYEFGVGQYAEIQSTNNAETGHQGLILNRQGGNVAIGTATASYRLHVVGNASAANNVVCYLNNTGGTRSRLAFQDTAVTYAPDMGSVGNSLTFDTVGVERVRVGNNGRTQFFAATEKYGVQLNNGSTGNGPFIGSDGADIFCISTAGGAERLRVNAAGELLIGTTTDNGAYLLQVNSQIYATNATIATSDSRFKTNVVSINNATSIIQLLRPVSFDFIPQTDRNFSSDRQIGLIAQEVQEVLSNIDYRDSIVAHCGDHFGLAYEKLVPLLIKALQETNQELQNIKNRLSALEGE